VSCPHCAAALAHDDGYHVIPDECPDDCKHLREPLPGAAGELLADHRRLRLDAARGRLAEVRAVQRRPDFRESVSPDLVHALRVRAQRDSQELERMSERAIQRDGEIRYLRAEVERLTAERDGWEPLTAALSRVLHVERAEVTRLRGLLARYARHVEVCEGIDFLDREPYEGDNALTTEELAELLRIRREAGQA
jgi:hypothetical protein